MTDQERAASEPSPKAVWYQLDSETQERAMNLLTHIAYKFVMSQVAEGRGESEPAPPNPRADL
jgi:hypothetical protein